MEYKALYRTYRPKEFEEVIGQESIIKTLSNSIKKRKIGHAYLFSGPRGTGKTSVAHLFAREVNKNALGEVQASELDIIEIDAASNNGVSEIRALIDGVNFASSVAKYKVYIIDEVHMLTTGAFNALLKTLEEPPSHIIFILATTEPHKIPITILSRLQRFNFKPIPKHEIEIQLRNILNKENIEYDNESIKFIARLSKGGLRDAISMADQASSFGDGKINFFNISQLFGVVSVDELVKLLNLCFISDANNMLVKLNNLFVNGIDILRITETLIDVLNDFVIFKKTNNANLMKFLSKDEVENLEISLFFAYNLLNKFISSYSDIKYSEIPNQIFELILLEVTSPTKEKVKDSALDENVFIGIDDATTEIETKDEPTSKPLAEIMEDTGNFDLEDTDEFESTQEMILSINNEIEESNSFVNQAIDAADILPPVAEEVNESDVLKNFVPDEEPETPVEPEVSNTDLDVDVIINMWIQSVSGEEKDFVKERLANKLEILGHRPEFQRFYVILKNGKFISCTKNSLILGFETNEAAKGVNAINRDNEFLAFVKSLFDKVILIQGISKSQFMDIQTKYTEMKNNHTLPRPVPIKVPEIKKQSKEKSQEESYGEDLFGELFN